MVRQGLGEAAVHGESPAPVAVLLAPSGHGRVYGETVEHGLKEAVAVLVELVLGDGLALGVEGVAGLAGQGFHAGILGENAEELALSRTPLGRRVVEPLDLAVREHDALDELPAHALAHRVVRGDLEYRR